MNPKNNRRVLFNFFKPRLPIKAEQTYPVFFFCEPLLSSEFRRGKNEACFEKEKSWGRGAEGGSGD